MQFSLDVLLFISDGTGACTIVLSKLVTFSLANLSFVTRDSPSVFVVDGKIYYVSILATTRHHAR